MLSTTVTDTGQITSLEEIQEHHTNILVRYLTRDDEHQSQQAFELPT